MALLSTEEPRNPLLSSIAAVRKSEQQVLGRTTLLNFQDPIILHDISYTGIALKKLREGETPTLLNR